MTKATGDILIDIPDDDLPKLAEMYDQHKNWAPQAYGTIITAIDWRSKSKEKYITLMSPNNCWNEDGTFFVIVKYYYFHLFIFTLDKTGSNVYKALMETKRLEQVRVFYCVHENMYPIIKQFIDTKKLISQDFVEHMFSISCEKASKFVIECPPEVYIKKLNKTHAHVINELWPHKFKDSEKCVSFLVEMNEASGVFLKSNDELVSWILVSFLGQFALLQTKEFYRKRGYACLVTKYMSKELAKRGHNAFATVLLNNNASIKTFEKLGFKRLGYVTYISVQ